MYVLFYMMCFPLLFKINLSQERPPKGGNQYIFITATSLVNIVF